jgi:preprotein translocase subunit Sec63
MSGNEIMVALVFLVLGYWLVSAFFARRPKPQAPDPESVTQTWHGVLSVDANASVEEIRAAYQRLMSQYHPDKVASLGAELRELAERKSKEITVAYREAMRSHGIA